MLTSKVEENHQSVVDTVLFVSNKHNQQEIEVKMASDASHYDMLGVSSTASYEEIKIAFHELARKSHPDKQQRQQQSNSSSEQGQNGDTEERFRRIQNAWEILRDDETRAKYDDERQQKFLKQKSKQQGAIILNRHELESAEDDETGETIYVYDCRCGEEVIIEEAGKVMVECPGCCFVYKIQ